MEQIRQPLSSLVGVPSEQIRSKAEHGISGQGSTPVEWPRRCIELGEGGLPRPQLCGIPSLRDGTRFVGRWQREESEQRGKLELCR